MLSKGSGCKNINCAVGTLTPEDNFVPFENINGNFLQSVSSNDLFRYLPSLMIGFWNIFVLLNIQ